MKLNRSLLAIALSFSLSLTAFLALPIQTATAQDSKIALQRGYRTGYSDGYMAGYRDSIDSAAKSYTRHNEYAKANRAYNRDYGTPEDYSEGYRQGFETGYDTGFEKRSFEAVVPENLNKRGEGSAPSEPIAEAPAEQIPAAELVIETPAAAVENIPTTPAADSVATDQTPRAPESFQKASFTPVSDAVIIIPRDTEIIVELLEDLNTERNNEGDKFTARIVSPTEIAGATIEGRVSKITKPGRIKRRSEMLLSFDRIILNEVRWSNFNAVLTEVLPSKGDNVKLVDNEGVAVGNHSYKQDSVKVGAATGTGLIIGTIAGGPVGAAVGAGVGAAFGVGAVVIERGKHIKLNRSQQLRVKTSYETQIR
ncbi:MAG: hypothetical protein ACR2M8_01215 [Pyrinomonadaceae bacterium]|jgi:hypothetical protein|nr:hypothetical protein [Blastocatellia bacterium]MDQ3220012.1 hypothetical protein [Acidobacteriota bacterium]MDQ3489785.1 hypothetical protein [Acidobacteriota bacterium]